MPCSSQNSRLWIIPRDTDRATIKAACLLLKGSRRLEKELLWQDSRDSNPAGTVTTQWERPLCQASVLSLPVSPILILITSQKWAGITCSIQEQENGTESIPAIVSSCFCPWLFLSSWPDSIWHPWNKHYGIKTRHSGRGKVSLWRPSVLERSWGQCQDNWHTYSCLSSSVTPVIYPIQPHSQRTLLSLIISFRKRVWVFSPTLGSLLMCFESLGVPSLKKG